MARIAGIAGKRRVRPQTLLRELAEACRVIDPDAYCRQHGCPRATCDESHSVEVE